MAADRLPGDASGIARAAEILGRGGIVAFPTDTVYGIGCRAGDVAALERVFAAKRRPPERAIAWLVASLADAEAAGFEADDRARALAGAFWPGGLTLVLPPAAPGPTQGFRVPNHPTALSLIGAAGPLAASSANRSGEPEAWDADDVAIAFADGEELDAIVDGGRVPGGTASSVLDLAGGRARLVRQGALSRAELEAVIGPID